MVSRKGSLQALFNVETAGSITLLAATLLALAWANSPWRNSYPAFIHWGRPPFTLQEIINEGLMTLFFFSVGMEIKRERVAGELRDTGRALLPLVAALGGMAMPALVYLAFNRAGPAAMGWGIPVATDIAFAIGVLNVLGRRLPPALPVFLLALAVFDDLGGILVIAFFYGSGFHLFGILGALVFLGALFWLNRRQVGSGWAYLLVGAGLWFSFQKAGVHATLAGVALGLAIPALPLGAAPLDRFLHRLHPLVAFGVIPVFALCNAGVPLTGLSWERFHSPVFVGVLVGLVVGKPVGILLFTQAAHRIAGLPRPGTLAQVTGVGMVAGIGFTVALFIAELAFATQPALLTDAKLAILAGSSLATLIGLGWLWTTLPRPGPREKFSAP